MIIEKILTLLRHQRAVAAVVLPRNWKGTKHWWSQCTQRWSEGIVERWDLHPRDYRCAPVNAEVDVETRRFGIAVVFVDYRRQHDAELNKGLPVEVVNSAWVVAGRPGGHFRYWHAKGGWLE